MVAEASDSLKHGVPGHDAPARRADKAAARVARDDGNRRDSGAIPGILNASGDMLGHAMARTGLGVQLALAETRLAAMSFLRMLFMSVLAAVLVLGAWGVLASGAILALSRAGIPLWALLSAVGLIHLAAAAWLIHRIRLLSQALDYPNTRALFLTSAAGEAAGRHDEEDIEDESK